MNKAARCLSLGLSLLTAVSILSACSKEPSEDPGQGSLPAMTIVPEENDSPKPGSLPNSEGPVEAEIVYPYQNPLSGMGSTIDFAPKRPIVVSLNNLRESLPQSGIQSAEIIYEVLAEGGITRLIAVFGDARSMPNIGTVRSTRPYIVDIATAYDPIFIHFGGSEAGKSQVRKNKIMAMDGLTYDGVYFWRDPVRKKTAGLEHSAFTSAAMICEAADKVKSLDLARDPEKCVPVFVFSEEAVTPSEQKADIVKIAFSNYNNKSVFTFDEESGLYIKGQYGNEHIDEATGKSLEIKNVFVLRIPSRAIDSVGRREMDTTGNGEGFYITNGGAVSIKWSRKDVYSQFIYTLEDGTELKINPGNSYINVVNELSHATFESVEKDD